MAREKPSKRFGQPTAAAAPLDVLASGGCCPAVVINNHTGGSEPDGWLDELLGMASATHERVEAVATRVEDAVGRIEALSEQLGEVMRLLKIIHRQETKEMVKLADIQAAVEQNASVQGSVISLLEKLQADLQSALDNGSDEELQAVIDRLNQGTQAMAAAVVANTPVAQEPAPAPVPEPTPEPAPEPVPGDDGSETGVEVPVEVEPAPEPTPDEPAPADTVEGGEGAEGFSARRRR